MTAQYWAWKNLEATIIGFFHYRRYLSFSEQKYREDRWGNVREDTFSDAIKEKYGLSDKQIEKVVTSYDLLISEEKNVASMPGKATNVYEQYQYGDSLHIEDLDCIVSIVQEKHPEYVQDLKEYLNGKYTCFCNMYIMKKELFHEYMEWLFDILSEFEKRSNLHDYSIEGRRTPGHLGERLLTLYYLHLKRTRQIKIKSLQTVILFHTEPALQGNVSPAFEKNNIAIAAACNENLFHIWQSSCKVFANRRSRKIIMTSLYMTQDNIRKKVKKFFHS